MKIARAKSVNLLQVSALDLSIQGWKLGGTAKSVENVYSSQA